MAADGKARVSPQALQLLTQQLSILLGNGVNIVAALTTLARGEDAGARQVFTELRNALERGCSLSEAMARQPQVFSNLYLRSIRAAERSGQLCNTLTLLGRHLAFSMETRRRLKAALIYPACVLVMAALMIAFLLYVQVPMFLKFFHGTGASLPGMTRALIFISRPELALGLVLALSIWGLHLRNLSRTAEGRRLLQQRLYALPAVGHVLKTAELAQLSMELAMSLRGGVDLLSSLTEMSRSPGGSTYLAGLAEVAESLKAGSNFPQALEQTHLYPGLFLAMVRASEETGRFWEGLSWYAEFASQEVTYSLETLLTLLEPLIIGGLGLVVSLIVLATFLPTYQLIGNI